MSTALARIESGMQPRDLAEARDFARLVAGSALLPQALRNRPEDVFVIVVSGHELGLSPMQAIRSISVIQGKPVLDAALMVALVKRRSEVCEYFTLVESSPRLATYETKRTGEPSPTRMSFTIEEAKAAGLTNKDNWNRHTAAMLRARASSALARAVYPDLVLGVYEPDEAEEFSHRGPAPVRMVRQEQAEDAVVEPPPTALESQLQASIDQAKAKQAQHPAVDAVTATFEGAKVVAEAPAWEELNDRLKKVPGFIGDDKETKLKRRDWWASSMGYRDVGPKWAAAPKWPSADPATKAHVVAELRKLEEAAEEDDDLPSDLGGSGRQGHAGPRGDSHLPEDGRPGPGWDDANRMPRPDAQAGEKPRGSVTRAGGRVSQGAEKAGETREPGEEG